MRAATTGRISSRTALVGALLLVASMAGAQEAQPSAAGAAPSAAPAAAPPPQRAPPYYYPYPYPYPYAYTPQGQADGEDDDDDDDFAERQEKARKKALRESTELASPGMLAGGIVMTSIGAVAMVSGLVLMVEAADTSIAGVDRPDDEMMTAGAFLLGGGAIVFGIGLPVLVMGRKRVPKEPGRWQTGASMHLTLGPGRASVAGRF